MAPLTAADDGDAVRRDNAFVSPHDSTLAGAPTEAAIEPAPVAAAPPRKRRQLSCPTSSGIHLKPGEIATAFEPLRQEYGPILSPEQVGRMLGYARATVYEWIRKGNLDGTFQRRGKHVRFWRDRVLQKFFNGPEWKDSNE